MKPMVAQQRSSSSTSSEATDSLVGTLLVVYVLLPTILLLIGVAVLYSILRKRRTQRVEKNGSKSNGSDGPLLDVWAERQRRGIGPAQLAGNSSRGEQQRTGDKPFGSKYYYAHNNPSSAGGYKDGLRMEDYTMNGPRLLARNGVAFPGNDTCAAASDISSPVRESIDGGVRSRKKATRRIVPVSHYLWDDPGKGTGTIRVDHLPHPSKPGEKRSWKESGIASVRACLVADGSGLEVLMESDSSDEAGGGGVEYRLVIPSLYGPVTSVSTVTKPTRLLVKLEKRTTLLDKSNAKPWPHPQKKLL
jgi:hypothetical protein